MQRRYTPHGGGGKYRSRGLGACDCGADFLWHAADGIVYVTRLFPGEADRVDIDAPLADIWESLGDDIGVRPAA